jgi:ISXO2-like transposase domain
LKHTPVVQDEGANAGAFFPIIHTLFSNIKAWLVGTHHGVSAKHLPRHLRERSYRFNRRNLPEGLDGYLIRRAAECATITYDQLKTGSLPSGANHVRRLPAVVCATCSNWIGRPDRALVSPIGVINLLPASYHGNPMSAEGSLVFTDFALSLVDDLGSIGFSHAEICCDYSPFSLILENNCPYKTGRMWPIYFRAQK